MIDNQKRPRTFRDGLLTGIVATAIMSCTIFFLWIKPQQEQNVNTMRQTVSAKAYQDGKASQKTTDSLILNEAFRKQATIKRSLHSGK